MKETKELLKFIFSLNDAFWKAFEDGKISLSDIVYLYEVIKTVGAAFNDINLAISEIRNMTEEEKQMLKTYIQVEFDLPNDQIELVVESGLILIVDLLGFFMKAKVVK